MLCTLAVSRCSLTPGSLPHRFGGKAVPRKWAQAAVALQTLRCLNEFMWHGCPSSCLWGGARGQILSWCKLKSMELLPQPRILVKEVQATYKEGIKRVAKGVH